MDDENMSYPNTRDADAIANVNFSKGESSERYCVRLGVWFHRIAEHPPGEHGVCR